MFRSQGGFGFLSVSFFGYGRLITCSLSCALFSCSNSGDPRSRRTRCGTMCKQNNK